MIERTDDEPEAFGEGDVRKDHPSLDDANGTLEAIAVRVSSKTGAEGKEPDRQGSCESAPEGGGA